MEKIIQKINNSKNIALFAHTNADPDALGSLGAMYFALKKIGKQCTIFLNEKPSWKFDFLSLQPKYEFDGQDYDLFLSVDVSTSNRLGIFEEEFLKHQNTVAIDHHMSRTSFATLEFVDDQSSNCDILFDLFEKMQIEIDQNIANALYLGIVGDTGGFMFSNTTPQTHIHASKLVGYGADFNKINQLLFMTRDYEEVVLMQRVISRMEIFDNVAISYVTEKDKKELQIQNLNSSDLVNVIKSIKGIEIAALIKQIKGKNYSISLRSSENFDVASFASKFGGGGHIRASGMVLVGSLAQVKHILKKELIAFGKK